MAKRRVIKSEAGVVLAEAILFGGDPRTRVGTRYEVTGTRRPEPRVFETVEEAAKFFHVQVSLSSRRGRSGFAAGVGSGRKTA